MPKKKKNKITIEEMKSYIKANLDKKDDVSISRIYETMTGITVSHKIDDNYIRLITQKFFWKNPKDKTNIMPNIEDRENDKKVANNNTTKQIRLSFDFLIKRSA